MVCGKSNRNINFNQFYIFGYFNSLPPCHTAIAIVAAKKIKLILRGWGLNKKGEWTLGKFCKIILGDSIEFFPTGIT